MRSRAPQIAALREGLRSVAAAVAELQADEDADADAAAAAAADAAAASARDTEAGPPEQDSDAALQIMAL